MVKKTIELEAKADKAIGEIEKLKEEIKSLNQQVTKGNEQTASGLSAVGAASKKTNNILISLGNTLKAIGIGVLLATLDKLRESFNQNQKVVDFFNTAFETLALAFSDFIDFISENWDSATKPIKDFFNSESVGRVREFAKIIGVELITRIKNLIQGVGGLGKALFKVFKGDFKGAAEEAKGALDNFTDSLVGNAEESIKVEEALSKVVSKVSNYVKETVKAARANVELDKSAEVARIKVQGLIESYDRQAEKLRQVRDEERNTIDERVAANNKLAEVLNKQQEDMLSLVDLQIKSAQAQYDKNQNQENYIALLEATQEREAVLAQIEGFRSEQLSNDLALSRERLELQNSLRDATFERALSEQEFNASIIDNEVARLQREKEINAEYSAIREKQLRDDLARTKFGTQAQVDATNALFDFQEETRQKELQLERDIQFAKLDVISNALGGVAQLVGEDSKFGKAIAVTQAIIDTYAGANKALAQGGIFGGIAAAGIIASGIANVRAITATETPELPSFASGGGGTFATSVPTPPQINTVGTSGINQLAETINAQTQQPVKAYVVSGEVTTAQALERNAVREASI